MVANRSSGERTSARPMGSRVTLLMTVPLMRSGFFDWVSCANPALGCRQEAESTQTKARVLAECVPRTYMLEPSPLRTGLSLASLKTSAPDVRIVLQDKKNATLRTFPLP